MIAKIKGAPNPQFSWYHHKWSNTNPLLPYTFHSVPERVPQFLGIHSTETGNYESITNNTNRCLLMLFISCFRDWMFPYYMKMFQSMEAFWQDALTDSTNNSHDNVNQRHVCVCPSARSIYDVRTDSIGGVHFSQK